MTDPRFEIVRSSAGFHARFKSSNGNIIMSSEVYTRRARALRAVELVTGDEVYYSPHQAWPEIRQGRLMPLVEIRDVDERQNGASLSIAPVYGHCTACGAVETLLNDVTGSRDLSSIGESASYPTGYGCEFCA